MDIGSDIRFKKIEPFQTKVWLSSPTMRGDEMEYVTEAYKTNWMSTVGENINELEKMAAEYIGVKHAVALSSGTAALHLAVKLAAERLYGSSSGVSTPDGLGAGGALYGKRVFCSDMTFDATVNPVVYEGGEPVFIDTEYKTWNMDPESLERAFVLYPDVKLVILAHLYGVPGRIDEIRDICKRYGALIIEDAAESLGATYKKKQTGTFGDYSCISFNGNKIITGSSGGMLLCGSSTDANKARKWSTQSREAAPWYQHEEIGYNYRISNVIAGVVRGQWPYLEDHINDKKRIYERYKEGLKDLPVRMNPYDETCSSPNYWLSCVTIDQEYMCENQKSEREVLYKSESGKSCPSEILDVLSFFSAEGRFIWKPMHLQPVYRNNSFVTREGISRGNSNAYIETGSRVDVGADIFARGLCLPSDNKMTEEQQDIVIDIIHCCFK